MKGMYTVNCCDPEEAYSNSCITPDLCDTISAGFDHSFGSFIVFSGIYFLFIHCLYKWKVSQLNNFAFIGSIDRYDDSQRHSDLHKRKTRVGKYDMPSPPSYQTLVQLFQKWSRRKTKQKRSIGHVLIWPNITIVVNVFQEILALESVRHIVSSKRVIVQETCNN